MQTVSLVQLKCLSTVASKLRLDKEAKADMVQAFSGGRATSSKDLYVPEAAAMIKHLKSMDPDELAAEKMRKKIISMAHEMGWKLAGKADMKRIDDWCTKFGYLHKHLNSYTYQELPKLVSQFTIAYKHYLNNF